MKKTTLITAMLCLCFAGNDLVAQTAAGKKTSGPYTLRNSAEFTSPKGHAVQDPCVFPDGILQVNVEQTESYNLQWFSNDLKMVKENTVSVADKFNKDVRFFGMVRIKNKLYAFNREVFRETESEGITALEISPKDLNVVGNARNLFKSNGKVRMESAVMFGYGTVYFGAAGPSSYDLYFSQDESKVMCTYARVSKERNDKLNKDIIGCYVFDENLTKVWGDEIEMPYTEAKMDNLGYTLTNSGKVCLLAKVYEGESKKDGAKDKTKPNYHFEVIVYDKGSKTPKKIEIKLDNYFNKEAYIYEDGKGSIVVAGFYGQKVGAGVDGSYILSLDVDKATISKVNGGYYELPSEFLKTFMSERQLKKAEEKMEEDEDFDLELNNLRIRSIYNTPDGATKMVAEIHYIVARRNSNGQVTYTYYYKDIVVMNIKGGKLEWVQKIPKYQMSATGRGCSINTLLVGDNVHVFWKDKPENSKRASTEKPARFGGTNGMLRGCMITPKGEMKFTDIVDVAPYDMHFDIQAFIDGSKSNLISTERRSKQNMIFSLDVKP
ncbi:MAG: hypothetical protein K0Q95_2312 [Bacteroidota bacterium]|jgi:hypothetical protein|nr:hypothetical protein [Bacteroidota bacterium]